MIHVDDVTVQHGQLLVFKYQISLRGKSCQDLRNQKKQECQVMEATKNQKRNQQIKGNVGVIGEVAKCHPLAIVSLVVPTILTSIVYFLMYDVGVFSDIDAYAQSGSLFDFYVLCSMSYLISMSAMWLTGANRAIKFLCVVMFIMVIENIAMAIDSQSYDEWYLLNTIDSYLQIICGVILILVIFTWTITRLRPYAYRLLGCRYSY